MRLEVDLRSHVPIYRQVIDGIKEQVAKGLLKPGDRLPTVRELAVELSMNHNTVAKAYQELERDRVIELTRGRGTFISSSEDIPNLAMRKLELREAMKKWLVEAHHLHLPDEEIGSMLRDVQIELRHTRGDD